MKLIVALFLAIFFIACSESSKNSAPPVDPIFGTWYYEAPGATSTSTMVLMGKISENGSIEFGLLKISLSGNTATIYIRKNLGTYVRNGNEFKVTYSYETCSPIGQETLYIRESNGNLIVESPASATTFLLARVEPTGTGGDFTGVMIEDKDCNIF